MGDLPNCGAYFPGRLECVLDRSWEVQPVTWSQLTWWDPLPCGQALFSQVLDPNTLPFIFPSPALSMLPNPPTPHRRLPPTHLSFRSTSTALLRSHQPPPLAFAAPTSSSSSISSSSSPTSPIPVSRKRGSNNTTISSSSPLAWPLPPSPDSCSSVFLPGSPSGGGGDADSQVFFPATPNTMSSLARPRSFTTCDSTMLKRVSLLPTPPDTDERAGGRRCGRSHSHKTFHFPPPPPPPPPPAPTLSPGLLPMPPPLMKCPPRALIR